MMTGYMPRTVWTFLLTVTMTTLATTHAAAKEPPRDYPIRPVAFTEVRLDDDFWAERIKTNRDVTVWYDFKRCKDTGRISNFAIAGGLESGDHQGFHFNDSDVFKVVEGAALSLATHPNPKLDDFLDDLIEKMAASQEEDGYLYTIRTINGDETRGNAGKTRWSHLAHSHELYNVGHMYEAAVAHYQATGKRTLLDIAIKNADLVDKMFGPEPGKSRDVPGHQEIEIGLVKLYRTTGDERYLKLAKFFLDERGRSNGRELYGGYCQDHKPVTKQKKAVGHAVRAAYMYSSMADVAALTGDEDYLRAIDTIWDDVVGRKIYITGGIGARRSGEAFGDAYELPNDSAYNETCAAIANAYWNHRMFLLHGDARYMDVVERVIYNGFLAGVSLSGDTFFYPNPLACNGVSRFNQGQVGRSPWFACACCPVNVVRFVPSVPGYVYATRDDSVYINLFAGGEGEVQIEDQKVRLRQKTDYPWEGRVDIDVDPEEDAEFAVRVRIPGWAQGRPMPTNLYEYVDAAPVRWTIEVNGEDVEPRLEKGFAVIHRKWESGDRIRLEMPMPIRRVTADNRVKANRGMVALERGPIVYCFESVDNDGEVTGLVMDDDAKTSFEHQRDLLDGIDVVTAELKRAVRLEDGSISTEDYTATAVPYYAWAHREIGPMTVWVHRQTPDTLPEKK